MYDRVFSFCKNKGNHKSGRSSLVSIRQEPRSMTVKHQLFEQFQPDSPQLLSWLWPLLFIWGSLHPAAKVFADYVTQHFVPLLECHKPQWFIVLTPYGITTTKSARNHAQISVAVQVHGPALGMATVKSQKHDLNSGFLKNEDNNNELLSVISEQIVKKHLGGKLLNSKCESVVSNRPCDVSTPQPCNNPQDKSTIDIPSSCACSRTWPPYSIMFELLIVLSWSLSSASSQHFVDSKGFCWVSEVGVSTAIFPSIIHAPILDLPDI